MSNETPVVRSVQKIQEQLADLDKVKRVAENYGTPDFASKLGMRSLLTHRQELLDELQTAEGLDTRFSIDIHGSRGAAFVQIENHIRLAIASGHLKPGERLPSKRKLAERLNVSTTTVARSYHDLEKMGLVCVRHGLGVFINKNTEAKCREDCRRRRIIIGRLYKDVAAARASGMIPKEIIGVVEASLAADASPDAEIPAWLWPWRRFPASSPATKSTGWVSSKQSDFGETGVTYETG